MGNFSSSNHHLRLFDELALKQTMIHGLHPLTKLITTLLFLITVVSYHKYTVGAMLPLIFYPVILLILADLPTGLLLKRMLVALPFVLGVGIFNPVLDRSIVLVAGGFSLTAGWISFASLILRFVLTVLAGLILVATTGIYGLASALTKLGLPLPFVVQLLFLYRYISVLGEEVFRSIRAHALRSIKAGGIPYRAWGSLLGLLLLRTMSRAERMHHAMVCRGFNGKIPLMRKTALRWADAAYVITWALFFALTRWIDLPQGLGRIIMGVI